MNNLLEFFKILNITDFSLVSSEEIGLLLENATYDIKYGLARNPNLTESQFDYLFKSPNIRIFLSSNPNLNLFQIDLLLKENKETINENLALSSKLTNEQINHLIQLNNNRINFCLIANSKVDDTIKQKIIDDTIKKEVFK